MSTVKISIPKPCSQKWHEFEKHDGKGYCTVCNKFVTDFSKYSDKELVNFFLVDKGKTCGKFRTDQLKIYQIEKKQNSFSKIAALLTAGIISITQTPEATAQNVKTEQGEKETNSKNSEERPKTSTDKSREITVTGSVISEQKDPVPGALIVVKGTANGVAADVDGNFRIVCDVADNDEITLLISFIGFQTEERAISTKKSMIDVGKIALEEDIHQLSTPQIVVSGFRGFLYRITHPFRNW